MATNTRAAESEPSLDALVRDPAQAARLSPETRAQVLARALVVIGALAVPASIVPPASPTGASGERAVRLKEASRMLGMSGDSLHRKWRALPELGGYVDADHRVKFPVSAIERYIRALSRR